MSTSPGRVPPADPHDITLAYRHQHPWRFDADTAPEAWHASADIYDGSGIHVEAHVGDFHLVAVNIDEIRDPFGLLDGEDADLGLIAETILSGGGELDAGLDGRLEPFGSRILILKPARLEPEWRGFSLGALLAGTAIRKLASGGRGAVCYPATVSDTEEEDLGPEAHEQSVRKLDRVWAQLGFEHFRDGIHVLDLNLTTLDENLAKLREKAERYEAMNAWQ